MSKPTTKSITITESKDSKETKKKPTSAWLKSIYDVNLLSKDELTQIYDEIRFIGFNRDVVLAQMEEVLGDPKLVIEAILVCSLRGPQAAQDIKLKNGRTLKQLGIPASGVQGTESISCQRISSSTADLAAFYFKKLNIPKRIEHELPAYLQFPTAGSIKLPQNLRDQHIDFTKKFSKIIKGEFNESIYATMVSNAYLDESLNLFE